jgi:hypothetical protein
VEAVRVKPLINGSPPVLQAQSEGGEAPGNDPTRLLPKGSEWSGKLFSRIAGERVATVMVTEQDGHTAILSLVDEFGTWNWYLVMDGSSFVVTEILPKTGGMAQIKMIRGSGSIKDGRLRWDGTWFWQEPSGGRWVWHDAGSRVSGKDRSVYLELSRD